MSATRTAISNCNEQLTFDHKRKTELESDIKKTQIAFHDCLTAEDWLGVSYTAKVISDSILWKQRVTDRIAMNEEWLTHIESPQPITDHE